MRAEGKVSEQVYQALKREYEAKVEELRRAFRRLGASKGEHASVAKHI